MLESNPAFFSPDVTLALRTGLRVLHFLGLVIGLGSATLLDLFLLRSRHAPVTAETSHLVMLAGLMVSAGLALLWISGVGFLLFYAVFDPTRLDNPKVWAKITIVLILSINGAFIHAVVLPQFRASLGRVFLSTLSASRQQLFMSIGVLSAVSWYIPLLLGAVPQLNGVVPATTILSVYGLILMIGFAVVLLLVAPRPAARMRQR